MKTYKIFLSILVASFLFAPLLFAKDSNLAAEVLFDFGKTLAEQHRYADAKQELKKCLILSPQHTQARKLLELCETKIMPEKDKVMLAALEEAQKNIKPEISAPPPQPKEEVLEKVMPREEPQFSLQEQRERHYIGGAWGIPKGHWLLESYTKYYYHNSQFDSKGKRKRWTADGRGYGVDRELKIDYGASKNLTLWAHVPYKETYWKDDNGKLRTRGLGDIWAGGKYRFLDKPLVLGLQLAGKFPTGYDENDSPSIGNGQIDQEITLLSAKSFLLVYYFRADVGYRWRYEDPADCIPYYLELGYLPLAPFDRIFFKIALDGIESISGTGRIEDYTKWVASVLFTLKKWVNPYLETEHKLDLELGYGETFMGKNTSAASEIFTKLLYYF